MFLKEITLIKGNSDHNKFPFSIPSIKALEQLQIKSDVTFFVGENGSGKSTLLEAIAYKCDFNTAGGGRNNNYELHAAESALGSHLRLSWMPKVTNGFFLRAESFYDFATHIDKIGGGAAYGERSLHHQSHGESFFSLFLNRFRGEAIYLLDEPEAALSPQNQLAFLKIINDLVKKDGAQLIIATHSPILLGYPGASIISFDDGLKEVIYEETQHYQISKLFLNDRDAMLERLFDED
ncbi:ABC transporter ATP-binding protein [Gracilibacillus halophilus YIM-C55.5]|uniref:ABC transporter ATP-binding protein n=1 Tax=Gracilibacillus halophilus YIM-C55.5 TaxID=1308866 RepID=N4WSB6_9BACI|nr:AAA family ATPase [Gracilibacillus halophilus]ENH96051.1 ABC transporter ATP-binding protein [Gracilibacillus halophilus YIM-C55.5]